LQVCHPIAARRAREQTGKPVVRARVPQLIDACAWAASAVNGQENRNARRRQSRTLRMRSGAWMLLD
jgi:hypothetical protein